jgi:small subunit ribosomal protein S21
MAEVLVREDEPLDDALRRFKRECQKSGVLKEIKKRAYYEKPSEKKRKLLRKKKKKQLRNTKSYRKR